MTSNFNPTQLVVFGDSLSDDGNLFAATGQPPFPAWDGRFSNGPVSVETLAQMLGATLTDNAFGGAEASPNSPPLISPSPPDLMQQVQGYLAALPGGQAPAGAAAVINIGSNDYSAYLGEWSAAPPASFPQAIGAAVQDVVGHVAQAVGALEQAGFQQIVLYTLPDFAITPAAIAAGPQAQAVAHALYVANNAALEQVAAAFGNVKVVDVFSLSDAVAADASAFGFSAPLTTTWVDQLLGGAPTYAPNEVMFWNDEHPTTAMHTIAAAYADAALTSDHMDVLDGTQKFVRAQDGNTFVFANALDPANASLSGDYTIVGGRGNDTIWAGSGDVRVFGGIGDDLIMAGSGDNFLRGGVGADVLSTNSLGHDTLIGGVGQDALIVNRGGTNTLIGGRGDDLFVLKESDALVRNGAPAFGDQHIVGGCGDDTLRLVINDTNPADEALFTAEFKKIEAAFDAAAKAGHPGSFSVDGLTVSGIDALQLQVDSVSTDPATPYAITQTIALSDGHAGTIGHDLAGLMTQATNWGQLTV